MPSLDEYRARYDDLRSLSDAEAIQQIAKVNGVDVGDVTSYLNYEPPGGDFLRQLKNSWTQTKQLGAGLGAAAAATAETSFGEGGLATGLKKAAVEKYKEIGNELQINSKASDSLSYSWEEAHKGNFGALVDWTQGAFGMGIGQIGQAIGTAGVGGIIGRTVGKKVVEGALSEMVEKEAKRLVLNNVAEDEAKKQAVGNVASRIGQNAAIGAQVLGMEGGEIGGDLAARATEEGRILTGAEIARALAATVVAAGPEAITERWALDAMTGKLPWLKAMEEASGVKGKTARAGMIGAAGATIGAGQEFTQTYIEEVGKGNPINDQTQRMAIDAAGLGAVGGAIPGAIGGFVTKPNAPLETVSEPKSKPGQVTVAEIEQMRVQRLDQLNQEEGGHEGGVFTNPAGGIDVIAPKPGRELSPQEKGERAFLERNPNPAVIAKRYRLTISPDGPDAVAGDIANIEIPTVASGAKPFDGIDEVSAAGDQVSAFEQAAKSTPSVSMPEDIHPDQRASSILPNALQTDALIAQEMEQAEQPLQPDATSKVVDQALAETLAPGEVQDVAAVQPAPKTAMQIAFEQAQQKSAARVKQPLTDQAQVGVQPAASMDVSAVAPQPAPQPALEAAAQADTAIPVEQRNLTRQERITQMTPADIEQELYVSQATGIKNRRALDEDMQQGNRAVTFIDLDGLKYINDTLGHEKGNELLKKFADAMKAAGIDGYHVSGDEFAILSDDMVKAKKAIKALETEASKVRIDSDTDSLKGITFSYGMSKDLATADANMQKMKASREQAGLRVRGGRPPNLVARLAPPSQPAPQQAPTTPAPRGRRLQPFTDNRLSDPEARLTLQAMADAAGWAEVGGRLTRDSEGNVGRTKWIPRADWFGDIQADKGSKLTGNLKGVATRVAVQKALSGEPMTEAQKRHVIAMLEWKSQEQLDYEAQHTGSIDPFTLLMAADADVKVGHGESLSDEALAARALEIDEEAVNRAMAASEYESEFLDEMRRIVDGEAQRQGEDKAVGGRSESVPGEEAEPASQEGFSLTGQTEAQRVAEEARKKAEKAAQDKADAKAEERARADREAKNFELGAPTNQSDLQEQEILQKADAAEAKAKAEEAAEKPAPSESSKPVAPQVAPIRQAEKPAAIADFGEKLAGARKDYAAKLGEVPDSDVASHALSETWPEPDYQKLLVDGLDPFAVAFARTSRDAVPPKPRKAWKLKGWVEQVVVLRKLTRDILSGDMPVDRLREELSKNSILTPLTNTIDLYLALGHDHSLKGIRMTLASYSVYGGVEYNPPRKIWSIERKAQVTVFGNMPRQLASGETKEAAIEAFKKIYTDAKEAESDKPKIRFDIYTRRVAKEGESRVFIGKKIGKDVVPIKGGFDSVAEARTFLADNQSELESTLDKMKRLPSERRDTNAPRVGVDHRSGGDVTPEQFSEAFGFRGVQFGNFVENDRRQQDLNETYDSLMDLAGVLGIPARALSLNGDLGLAFGARGRGGKNAFAAHYEPKQVVINLTKKRGAGSLAHELFHAIDNYFSRMRSNPMGYLTEDSARNGDGVRKEMLDAFGAVTSAIRSTGMMSRARILDRTRSSPYWATTREMVARSFESYIVEKLKDQGAANDYLANIVSQEYWDAATSLGLEKEGSYPYPLPSELPAIRAAFDQFFQAIDTKETDKGVALFSRGSTINVDGIERPTNSEGQQGERTVSSVTSDIEGNLGNGALAKISDHFMIVEDMAALKADMVKRASKFVELVASQEGFLTKGLYDPSTDTSYIVAGNLSAEDSPYGIFLHEVGEHYGLEKMLGPEAYKGVLNQAQMILRAGGKAMREAAVRVNASENVGLDPEAKNFHLLFADKMAGNKRLSREVIAYLADNPKNHELPFMRRIMVAVREFMRKLGFTKPLTTDDIVSLITTAARRSGEFSRREGQSEALRSASAPALFARKKFDTAGSLVGSKFTLPPETSAQKAQRFIQKESNRFQVVQDAVAKQGGKVDESSNFAEAVDRYPGRLAAAMKDAQESIIEPFAKRIHDAGTTTDEVSLLAYAEHAPERNAEIAKINPRFPNDGTPGKSGSGMTDQEAADIINQVKALPNAAEMFSLSEELRGITDQNLDNLVAGGEMEQTQADQYRDKYKFYVPLKGFELVDESGMTQPTGKGLSTGASLGFSAMGRESRAGQIFEHTIQDYENGLMLSEKAVVAKTLRNFVKANPDDALWTIDNAPKKPRLEKGGSLYQIIAGGNLIAETASKDFADSQVQALLPTDPTAYVAEVKPSPKGLVKWRDSPFDPEEEIRFIENGKPVRIQLSDAGMVRSYNRLWHSGVSDGLTLLNSYNGWLRQMYTQKNPAWFVMNAQKDILSVMPYVTGEAGIKTALKIPGNIPGAFRAAWAFHHNKTAGAKWNALIEQFKAAGGYTGFAFVGDIEAQTSRLNGAIARHTGWDEALGKFKGKGIKAGVSAVGAKVMNTAFFSWIEAMNSTFENMTRLAVFKSAIDSGMTPNEAGKLAKNASTNFNTRGEWGPNINAVWLFANAGIQGTRNVGHAMMFSPHKEQVWALMGGLVALGMMAGLMSDDDDDLLDDQLRSRTLVFKVGDAQLSLPMPYGFGFFSGFGQLAAQAMKHPEKRDNIALKMATLAFDHFSPVGDPLSGEADLKNAVNVMPTSIKPVLDVAANVSPFGGGPLFPESPYDETKPDSTKMWASTRGTGYDKTAQWINALTGGDQYKAGAISVSPETLKLSVSTLFGGAGKLASDLASLPFDVSSETVAPSKIPILKNYIREVDQKAYLGRFYDQAQEAQDAYTIWRRYLKAGMVDEATSYKQGEAAMISMGGLVSSYRKQIKMLRDMESMTVNSDLSPTEKNIRLAKTNASIVQITSAFNDRLKAFH